MLAPRESPRLTKFRRQDKSRIAGQKPKEPAVQTNDELASMPLLQIGQSPCRGHKRGADLTPPCAAKTSPVRNDAKVRETHTVRPGFRWAWVGADSAGQLAEQVGIAVTGFHRVGERVAASLAPS